MMVIQLTALGYAPGICGMGKETVSCKCGWDGSNPITTISQPIFNIYDELKSIVGQDIDTMHIKGI